MLFNAIGAVNNQIVPVSYILDTVEGSVYAFSLRKLKSTAMNAIRVRRSSDDTEQDIGFSSSGGLDTSALSAFVGTDSAYIKTWYDQSGNGYNAVMTTDNAKQPRIVNAGTIQVDANSKPIIYFDGSNDYLIYNAATTFNQPNTISVVAKWRQVDATSALFDGIDATRHFVSSNSAGKFKVYAGSDIEVGNNNTNHNIYQIVVNGATSYVYINGTQLGAAFNPGASNMKGLVLGQIYILTQAFKGSMSEFVMFDTEPANIADLKTNQGTYYGITVA